MPYVTVYTDVTPFYSDGSLTTDTVHTWYSIDDGLGNPDSVHTYSFMPGYDDHGMVLTYEDPARADKSYTWEITQDQYDQIKAQSDYYTYDAPPPYNFLGIGGYNCVTFTKYVLGLGGIDLTPSWTPWHISNKISFLDSWINIFWEDAQRWRPRGDPIALDLDGDGLETTAVENWETVQFDHNNDGIKTATGWVKPDDGLLVLDRDGNGTIDSGRELFGDNTQLSNSELAADGFMALADLDTNGDGLIDAQDSQFWALQVWQDLNQDGVSQAGELHTLNELGIESISATPETANQNLNGNILSTIGSYTKTDGSTGMTGGSFLGPRPFLRNSPSQ